MKTTLKASFKVFNTNAKGEVSIGLVLKGELSDTQILTLHRLKAAGAVFADLYSSQTDIDDFSGHDDESEAEPHRGMSYTVKGGEVKLDPEQLDIDDVIKGDGLKKSELEYCDEENNYGKDEEKSKEVDWLDENPDENKEELSDELE